MHIASVATTFSLEAEMTNIDDQKRFLANRQKEIDGAALYRVLAESEAQPQLAALYQKFAESQSNFEIHQDSYHNFLPRKDSPLNPF